VDSRDKAPRASQGETSAISENSLPTAGAKPPIVPDHKDSAGAEDCPATTMLSSCLSFYSNPGILQPVWPSYSRKDTFR
jgi:hypothetical protein